jgi:hypothetical protein
MDASAADVRPRLEGLIDATRAFSADAALGLTARLAAGIPEWHTGFVQHPGWSSFISGSTRLPAGM